MHDTTNARAFIHIYPSTVSFNTFFTVLRVRCFLHVSHYFILLLIFYMNETISFNLLLFFTGNEKMHCGVVILTNYNLFIIQTDTSVPSDAAELVAKYLTREGMMLDGPKQL